LRLDFAPHPAAPRTVIRFELPAPANSRLLVYDLSGRLVASLIDQPLSAGRHDVPWSGLDARGREVANGIYVVRLETGARATSRRLVVLK
jgi:flagellar hook assembly protein FlgD